MYPRGRHPCGENWWGTLSPTHNQRAKQTRCLPKTDVNAMCDGSWGGPQSFFSNRRKGRVGVRALTTQILERKQVLPETVPEIQVDESVIPGFAWEWKVVGMCGNKGYAAHGSVSWRAPSPVATREQCFPFLASPNFPICRSQPCHPLLFGHSRLCTLIFSENAEPGMCLLSLPNHTPVFASLKPLTLTPLLIDAGLHHAQQHGGSAGGGVSATSGSGIIVRFDALIPSSHHTLLQVKRKRRQESPRNHMRLLNVFPCVELCVCFKEVAISCSEMVELRGFEQEQVWQQLDRCSLRRVQSISHLRTTSFLFVDRFVWCTGQPSLAHTASGGWSWTCTFLVALVSGLGA